MSCFFDILPDEIIQFILSFKSVGYQEVCCFQQCCKRFDFVAKNDSLWKLKAKERWKIWSKQFQGSQSSPWRDIYKTRHQVETFVKKQLCLLQEESGLQSPISKQDFGFLNTCLNKFEGASHLYLNDAIESILTGTGCSKNLTEKYLAKKAKISLTHLMCKNDLNSYLENPEQTEQLDQGATIIARWMCPLSDISFEDINKKLEDITNMVKDKLDFKDQNLSCKSDNFVQLKVLNGLKDVFYNQLKFSGNKEDYYNLSNSYINEVLETKLGIPISLSVLFQSIAKRIGLCIEPLTTSASQGKKLWTVGNQALHDNCHVNCPGHFLVRWKYFDSSVNEMKYRHIDCFNNGVFLDHNQLPHSLSPGHVPAPRDILKRMMLNIIHILQNEVERTQLHETIMKLSHALDLFMILIPDHPEMTRLNARIKLYLRIQLEEVITSLGAMLAKQLVQHSEDKRLLEVVKQQSRTLKKTKTPKVKLQSDPKNAEVSLKVGTIMHHRRFDYRCVVYGWDPVCKMPEEWIVQMGVDNLSNGRNQPFYNVLVSDGTERYASQENLVPETDIKIITHPDVGRYFKEFTGERYIPNDQLQKVYPEDLPVP